MGNYSTLVMIALMVLAFYLLILRPQKKRQQAIQQTLNSLAPGSRVLLGSGLFGTIVAIGDRQAVLEISPGVELTVLKQAIVRTVTEADEDGVIYDDDDVSDELTDDEPRDRDVVTQDIDYSGGTDRTGSSVFDSNDRPVFDGGDRTVVNDGTDRNPFDGTDRTNPSAGADPKRLS